jgi:hypothetical protein
MKQPTTERLAQAMREAGCPADAIALALSGHYDDFKSSIELPMVQLVNDLRANGFNNLADRAIAGEFDSTPEESSAWFEGRRPKTPRRKKPRGNR